LSPAIAGRVYFAGGLFGYEPVPAKAGSPSKSSYKINFADINRVILEDLSHSGEEKRYYCIGKINDGILTVRFTIREEIIRIFGAGYWRKGKKIYEEENKIQ
jgi:uncharacterized DUF497 family protein